LNLKAKLTDAWPILALALGASEVVELTVSFQTAFKAEWFGTYRNIPKFDALVQSWDCAFKTGRENDYSACVTLGHVRDRSEGSLAAPGYYLLNAWRGKIEFADLKRKAAELYQEWRPSAVLVEDTASGQSLLQELLSNTTLPFFARSGREFRCLRRLGHEDIPFRLRPKLALLCGLVALKLLDLAALALDLALLIVDLSLLLLGDRFLILHRMPH
jgi:hypothetical protein